MAWFYVFIGTKRKLKNRNSVLSSGILVYDSCKLGRCFQVQALQHHCDIGTDNLKTSIIFSFGR